MKRNRLVRFSQLMLPLARTVLRPEVDAATEGEAITKFALLGTQAQGLPEQKILWRRNHHQGAARCQQLCVSSCHIFAHQESPCKAYRPNNTHRSEHVHFYTLRWKLRKMTQFTL